MRPSDLVVSSMPLLIRILEEATSCDDAKGDVNDVSILDGVLDELGVCGAISNLFHELLETVLWIPFGLHSCAIFIAILFAGMAVFFQEPLEDSAKGCIRLAGTDIIIGGLEGVADQAEETIG